MHFCNEDLGRLCPFGANGTSLHGVFKENLTLTMIKDKIEDL